MIAASAKPNAIPLLTISVRKEVDIVTARQRARQLAGLFGFGQQDQVRIATAVSEIARNAYQFGGGRVEFAFAMQPGPQALAIKVSDHGPGIADVESVLSGRHESSSGMGIGITGCRRLMDTFEIETKPGEGTVVSFSKFLPTGAAAIHASDISHIVAQLAQLQVDAGNESLIQSSELLETLESLRQREIELDKRQAEMRRLNAELDETNRGVVALYAELEQKAIELRAASELKGRFLRHVTHEFRTPLNSILALTQLLLRRMDGELTAEQERQVGYIRKAAQDLTEIVNDLLDLAKVEAGKTEVQMAHIQVAHLLSSLRGVMRPLVTSDQVALIFEDAPEDWYFRSDESKVAQILRNLISNALKFTERGEIRIRSGRGQGQIWIAVSDTGVGIAPENQELIFQEFTQLKNPMQGRVKGTGLGLPLSRRLASLLGGELTVSSRPGEGSTFTLLLPWAERDDAQTPADSILIIDDDESARYIARQRFRGTRYRILEASGGIEGSERARFEKPALILLDLVMPDRDGFEVLDDLELDPTTRTIPVILHTSRRLNEADWRRLRERHVAVLPKGEVWPANVVQQIRDLLREPELFSKDSPPNGLQ